jgi:hypothetical protein
MATMAQSQRAQYRPGGLPRCTEPSCPFRWTAPGATDHPCAEHSGDGVRAAARSLGLGTMHLAELAAMAPGDHGRHDGADTTRST